MSAMPEKGKELAEQVQGAAYAGCVVILFSGFVIASRLGLSRALALPDIAMLRFGLSGIVLLPFLMKYRFSSLRPLEAIALAMLGGLGFALFAYSGFALAPAAHGAVLLHGTLSLTTAVLLWVFGGRAPGRGQIVGLATIILGIAAMVGDGFARVSPTVLIGDASLLLASLCWSAYALYVRHLKLPAVHAAAVVAVISVVMFLPIYTLVPGKMLLVAPWPDLLFQAIFQGILIGVVSIFVYTRAVVLIGPSRVSLFTAIVPVITMIAAIVLLGEVPTALTLVGLVLVTGGMVVALRFGN